MTSYETKHDFSKISQVFRNIGASSMFFGFVYEQADMGKAFEDLY